MSALASEEFYENAQLARNISNTYGLHATIFLGEWDKLLFLLSNISNIEEDEYFSFLQDLKGINPNELKIQYDNLFVAPGFYFVSPFRDSYFAEDSTREELSFMYEQAGLTICDDKLELPDHIGCILSYLQWLVYMEHKAWEKNDIKEAEQILDLERNFINKNLSYIPRMKEKIGEKLEFGFMLDAINGLEAFINWHLEELKS